MKSIFKLLIITFSIIIGLVAILTGVCLYFRYFRLGRKYVNTYVKM
ncbi:MAG: hypothetical protein LBL93_05355 [Ruminococcus sp.]|nr:hypothetical protein [Ruminococcus sp.]